ncbi:hypothetical protein [Oculatella sp. LEGE 06141]
MAARTSKQAEVVLELLSGQHQFQAKTGLIVTLLGDRKRDSCLFKV